MEILMKVLKAIIATSFGIVLFLIWLYSLINIEFILFSEKELVHGIEVVGVKYPKQYVPMLTWFTYGVFPLFLIVGHYLLYGRTEGGLEKKYDIMAMKSILIGYLMWLPVSLLIALLAINIPDTINIVAGFLTMIIIYLFMINMIAINEGKT